MLQLNVHEAKTQLSRLLEVVEQGGEVVIARHGRPVVELVRARGAGLPLGIAKHEPIAPAGDGWWQSMTDEEAESWIDGR